MATTIALFTRNLRLHDNPVLLDAAVGERMVPLFVRDDAITAAGFTTPNRSAFLADCLADLDARLRDRGSRLVVRHGDVVEQVRRVASEVDAGTVHVAADVSGYDRRRRDELRTALAADGRELVVHDAVVTAVPPGELTPQGRDHFAIFTPYHRHWAERRLRTPLPVPALPTLPAVHAEKLPTARDIGGGGDTSPDLVPGGETEARERLDDWVRRADGYADHNDSLADDGTSRLSPYLHFGCLSATEVVHRVGTRTPGGEAFVRQVAWRDFHHQVLAARPASSRRDYRTHDDRWRRDDDAFEAWRAGRTGYPVVDAGMRQLGREGWMHNRARLLVGSFLTKTLYLDWRLGAAHFLELLVDGDVANNQMNWQWIAGTGTDTRPNRVLNPLAQARRHDPRGDYVRRYVPELADVDGVAVHEPWRLPAEVREKLDYPAPIVDLDEGYRRFRAARGK